MADLIAIPAQRPALLRFTGLGRTALASTAGRRVVTGLLGAASIAFVAWLVTALQPDSRRPVAPGMSDGERAAASDLLRAGGFDPTIDRATGEVLVPDADYHRARMALAAAGVPKSAPSGYAVLDNLPLGVSRSVEAARLRQAQETDLAATITAIGGVEAAQVHLASADASPFVRDSIAPSAAVFVRLAAGRALGQGQTDAIVHLVSASVAGLADDRVSVVDQSGRLLTAVAAGRSSLGRAQLDYAAELEARYRDRIAALLLPIAGAGNFSSEVTLDIDFARVQSTRERVEPGNAVVTSEQGGVSRATPPPAAGIPGALSNAIPAPTQISDQRPKDTIVAPVPPVASGPFDRTFEVGRTIEVIEPPAGAVRRVSAGIVLRAGSGVSARQLAKVTALVRDAVGFDPARGDRVSVILEPFVEITAPEAPWTDSSAVKLAERIGLPLVIGLIVTFGVGRPLAKRLPAPRVSDARSELARLPPADPRQQIEAVRVFVRDNPATASRALRQLVRAAPAP